MQCSLVGLPHQALSQPTRTMTTAALALASTLKPTFPPAHASLFRSPASALVNVRIFYLPAPTTPLLLLFLSSSASFFGIRHFEQNMASDAIEAVSKMAPSQEDLTDEQMEEMLAQATTRLREKEEAKMFQTEAPQKFTFPKMNAGALEKPYVVVKGHVAEADKSRLIDDKHRQAGSLIRKVEDPVTAKKLAAEVRHILYFTKSHHVYEEDIPIFSLEQSRGTVLVSFCQTESSFIHSYSETLPPHCLT